MGEGEAFIRAESPKRGMDPEIALTVAKMEGGVDAPGLVGKFDTGWSFWQYQLHYGGPDYPQFGTVAGMGNAFTQETGWAPGDPAAWKDSVRYALDHAKLYGWGAWYGAAKAGIVGMRGIDVNYPWSGTPDGEWDYQKRGAQPMATLPYDPDAVVDQQPDDYSCSLQSTQFLLRSIGRNPDASDPKGDPWMRSQLIPNYITSAKGLLDGSGRQLATWITEMYGREMGFKAQATPVTFDDVWAGAGVNPMICGGIAYNHWVGIRKRNTDGTLAIANPAIGYKGIGENISRAQWDQLGPWNCIWIDRLSTLEPTPPPTPLDWPAELRAILAADDRDSGARLREAITALLSKA